MASVLAPAEQRVLLGNVRWETYERLLADCADQSAPRFTYDRGMLEVMSPSAEHELYNRTLALLVEVAAEELDIDLRNLGSTTFKRADLARGFEPDSCFYIQNAERVRGRTQIDLGIDPPPDLVIEVDITSPSLAKLPIYAQIGVPEVWRYDGAAAEILERVGSVYVPRDASLTLPGLTAEILTEFLEESKSLQRNVWLRRLRDWLRREKPG